MNALPILDTERLILRAYQPADEAAYVAMVGDLEVMRYLPGGRAWGAAEAHAAFERRLATADPQRRHWALVEKATNRVIGWVGLMPLETTGETEIYYGLTRDAWGKGFATEAAQRALRFAFEDLGLPRVVAVVQPENLRSIRVASSLGMSYRGDAHHYGAMVRTYALPRPGTPLPEAAPSPAPPPPSPAPAPAFCTACGAALVAGASFCGSCGRPIAKRATWPPPPVFAPAPPPGLAPYAAAPPVSEGTAIVALIVNVFIPGLGTIIAGHRVGWSQLGLFLGGWLVLILSIGLLFPVYVAMWIGAWIWALVTSIQMLSSRGA